MTADDHYHTENNCLHCAVSNLYKKIQELTADNYHLAAEVIVLKKCKQEMLALDPDQIKEMWKRNYNFEKSKEHMDKAIKKIAAKEKTALKDTKKLLVMDKKKDKEQAHDKMKAKKCDMEMKKKKK